MMCAGLRPSIINNLHFHVTQKTSVGITRFSHRSVCKGLIMNWAFRLRIRCHPLINNCTQLGCDHSSDEATFQMIWTLTLNLALTFPKRARFSTPEMTDMLTKTNMSPAGAAGCGQWPSNKKAAAVPDGGTNTQKKLVVSAPPAAHPPQSPETVINNKKQRK